MRHRPIRSACRHNLRHEVVCHVGREHEHSRLRILRHVKHLRNSLATLLPGQLSDCTVPALRCMTLPWSLANPAAFGASLSCCERVFAPQLAGQRKDRTCTREHVWQRQTLTVQWKTGGPCLCGAVLLVSRKLCGRHVRILQLSHIRSKQQQVELSSRRVSLLLNTATA